MQFYSNDFLKNHCLTIFDFYAANLIDPSGGYRQNFYDDGSTFNHQYKHLVSSTRMIVNYATAAKILNKPEFLAIAQHGLDFLENNHWQSSSQGYAWTLNNNQPLDMSQQAYGYAFVLLAYSAARKADLLNSNDKIIATFDLLEQRFWQAEFGLYADTIDEHGELSDYRGQNANMHLCEAMIAAYQATNETIFLDRAFTIAHNICQRQAALSDDLVWEHFTPTFDIDWQYNKDDPKNLYRPWGFQPGHQTEWSKLLLQIYRYRPQPWLITTAKQLFDRAFTQAWDKKSGGLIYGFDQAGSWCDDDKYFWVQAETIAAAALLYQATNDTKYLTQYNQLWQYCWQHFVDHKYGAWFRVLKRDNSPYSNEKSAAGAKCDYHTLCAFMEVINTLKC